MNYKEYHELKQELKQLEHRSKQILELGGNVSSEMKKKIKEINDKLKKNNLPDLEEKFKKEYDEFYDLIRVHLIKSEQELNEAMRIADAYGLPFDSDISPTQNRYLPASAKEKWQYVDNKMLKDHGIDFDEYYYANYSRWQYSTTRC